MTDALSPVVTGALIGIALGAAPGAVQAIVVAEALRGGVLRGLRAVAGANVVFGLLLLAVALGITVAYPRGVGLRVVEVAGAAFLLWQAVGAFRRSRNNFQGQELPSLSPAARGALAVVLNPGGWLFLATAATALFAAANQVGGRLSAVAAAFAVMAGIAIGDVAVVLIAALGLRAAGPIVQVWVRRALALFLAGLGLSIGARGVLAQ